MGDAVTLGLMNAAREEVVDQLIVGSTRPGNPK